MAAAPDSARAIWARAHPSLCTRLRFSANRTAARRLSCIRLTVLCAFVVRPSFFSRTPLLTDFPDCVRWSRLFSVTRTRKVCDMYLVWNISLFGILHLTLETFGVRQTQKNALLSRSVCLPPNLIETNRPICVCLGRDPDRKTCFLGLPVRVGAPRQT